jgi:hypothetical protein
MRSSEGVSVWLASSVCRFVLKASALSGTEGKLALAILMECRLTVRDWRSTYVTAVTLMTPKVGAALSSPTETAARPVSPPPSHVSSCGW